ncbi:hypothetical protein ABZ468_45745 [Streptomyces sp. NPDC005708]|uniref:hypothetical protein n=1 Tax=Streptomyces sp. NPDC005708 TaxID=3154564 RepID=UPI0033C0C148
MPVNHARKTSIRQRMARTGERFREAAHAIDVICASPEPPLCALHTSFWGCPEDCPHRDYVHDTPEYRAWAATPRVVPDDCPGSAACTDPDCPNGCNDIYVSMCWDCLYVFGATDDDPQDGSCPNGCDAQRPLESAWLAALETDGS